MSWLTQMQTALQEDIKTLCGECEINNGILRAMAGNLGINNAAVIFEAAVEALPNGDDDPYPIVHFNITLAKDVEPEFFPAVAQVLNDINVVTQTGEFPSFGNFCLYKPLRQIFYGYRMPVSTENFEAERENIRFFLASVFEQLDQFVDLILYACEGNDSITIDQYLSYLKSVDDYNNIDQRIELLKKALDEVEVMNEQIKDIKY